MYREWRISGDTGWLRRWWPKVRASLEYCTRSWDPRHRGWIEEPHLTTYDVKLWGADSLCTSLYVGALKAAALMGAALGEFNHGYSTLLESAVRRMEVDLFNGEYFCQRVEWKNLEARFPPNQEDRVQWLPFGPDMQELATREGPPYQYGSGCLADGVLGAWLAFVAGVPDVFDRDKLSKHLNAVHRHNYMRELTEYPALGQLLDATASEGGVLVCTWPRGARPTIPTYYSDNVWTGTEYQVAAHLVALGEVEKGSEIVRTSRRRYDGRIRNPFAAVEAGQWYARAMSSYSLLQAFSGARFDAVDKILYLKPAIKGDFRCFISTATGYGTVGVKSSQPFVEVVSGSIPYRRIEYTAA